jgi:hypothetical protein
MAWSPNGKKLAVANSDRVIYFPQKNEFEYR